MIGSESERESWGVRETGKGGEGRENQKVYQGRDGSEDSDQLSR